MADDAGALLVRSGLVSSSALDEARAKVADAGGTIGEQLVAGGTVDDEALTNFYKQRLLVPQVNPNTLARLPAKVVAVIPSDMAIELRAIPVSLDNDNNLTVAMSDPSDRHAVDEISFFTGAYVVRAVATQMQIAWCLAHYYGHVTGLGERLLEPVGQPRARTDSEPVARPRTRGNTGKIEAARHKAIVPGESIDVMRPSSEVLDQPKGERDTEPLPAFADDSGPIVSIEEMGGIEGSGPLEIEVSEPDDADDGGQEITIEADVGKPYEPVFTVEAGESRPVPRRRRPAEADPPELAARAGEVQLETGVAIRKIAFDDEPRIIVADNLAEENPRLARQVSGEVRGREHRDRPPSDEIPPSIFIELGRTDAIIFDELEEELSRPVMLDRRRRDSVPEEVIYDDEDVVVLHPKRVTRRDRNTQLGIGVVPAATRAVPSVIDNETTDASSYDPTRVDAHAAPPHDDDTSSEIIAAPPATASRATPPPSGQIRFERVRPAPDTDDYEEEEPSKPTAVMTAIELEEMIPGHNADVLPAHLSSKRPANDEEDDDDAKWGPPGTTIPPPLLGAIPGTLTPALGIIPISDVDSAPLMVTPPTPPERGARAHTSSEITISKALENATSRVLELIHTLDHTTDRDQIIAVLIAHLAESHRRAGFFAMRGGALSLFAITPRIPAMPTAVLHLDAPSTLQDVVDTRLPYRGPMLDDASRTFLTATLGACPPEILLVPITVKERVVGVLFGDQRVRHTFDDQLALAARAAGMALESLLQTRRR